MTKLYNSQFSNLKIFSHLADSTNAHVIGPCIARRSVLSGVEGVNQRIVLVGAVKFARVVKVEEWEPRVSFAFDDFVVSPRALLSSIARLVFRTWIDTAGLVASSLTDAE